MTQAKAALITLAVTFSCIVSVPRVVHADEASTLCDRYHFTKTPGPPLTDAEKKLICGTPPSSSGALDNSRAWTKIPSSQAVLSITAFLQGRGYLNPKITSHGLKFDIDPGPISYVSRVSFEGAPETVDFSALTKHAGEKLTPGLLSGISGRATEILIHHGYPCPDVHAEAFSDKNTVLVHVRPGERRKIGKIELRTIPGTMEGILSRYDAFQPGDLYDDELLAISADRAIFSGVVEDSYFVPVCNDTNEVGLKQEIRAGAPRIFTLGFNLNTEEIGRISASLKDARIGETASQAALQLSASSKIQDAEAFYQGYFLSTPSRQWIRPLLRAFHENEDPFEVWNESLEADYGTSWDALGAYGELNLGPRFALDQTQQGLGPGSTHALFLSADLRLMSHEFEFNHNLIRGGSQLEIRTDLSDSSVLSRYSARGLSVIGEKAWRTGAEQAHSFVVFRARGGWRTTGFDGPSPASLPPELREYLGGQADLRGFGRMELPGNGQGGLSAWFGNLEARPDFFGERLEPIAFVDAGGFGDRSFSIQSPIYWSPGAGIDFISPIGTFQATLAHGFVTNGNAGALSHWQFYLSLGGSL